MDRLLEKRNAVIKALTLSAILDRGSAPLPLKIWQDVMLLSQGHTRLVTTKSTQGIPIPILNSATALLRGRVGRGKPAKGSQIKCHRGAGSGAAAVIPPPQNAIPEEERTGELTKKTPATTSSTREKDK